MTTMTADGESRDREIGNWEQRFNGADFIKWGYRNSPYRVVADMDGRGHWRAMFTSVYGTDAYLIAGNCGGGQSGMVQAVSEARRFMKENKYGCPPPNDYK